MLINFNFNYQTAFGGSSRFFGAAGGNNQRARIGVFQIEFEFVTRVGGIEWRGRSHGRGSQETSYDFKSIGQSHRDAVALAEAEPRKSL